MNSMITAIPQQTILVLGDFVVDEYQYGQTIRVSREAPVPVVRYQGNEIRPGGAANVVSNIVGLGAKAIPLGIIGQDLGQKHLFQLFEGLQVITEHLIIDPSYTTAHKTRIMAGAYGTSKQQVLRLDHEPSNEPSQQKQEELLTKFNQLLKLVDAVIISDYGMGCISPSVIKAISTCDKPTFVDSRYNLLSYSHVTAVTPNTPETEAALKLKAETDQEVIQAGTVLLKKLDTQYCLITRGQNGMALFSKQHDPQLIPIQGEKDVTDVTGAGDTVISLFACALTAGASPLEAMKIANKAAGIVVTKPGTANVSLQEL